MGLYRRLARRTEASWDQYFRWFIVKSFWFYGVSVLFVTAFWREISILSNGWGLLPLDMLITFCILVLVTPLLWLRLIIHHRQIHRTIHAPADQQLGAGPVRAELAREVLNSAVNGYALLHLSLSVLENALRRV